MLRLTFTAVELGELQGDVLRLGEQCAATLKPLMDVLMSIPEHKYSVSKKASGSFGVGSGSDFTFRRGASGRAASRRWEFLSVWHSSCAEAWDEGGVALVATITRFLRAAFDCDSAEGTASLSRTRS